MNNGKVLIVEDEEFYTRAYLPRLARHGYETAAAQSVEEALGQLEKFQPDVVILDLMLQRQEVEEGFEVLGRVGALCPQAKVIVVTSHGRAAIGERALQLGAYDFIDKEERGYDELTFRVNQAYDRVQLERSISDQRGAEIDRVGGYRYGQDGIIVGTSPPMQALFQQIDRVAPAPVSVLVLGESGSGKELVAQALHENGPRAIGPLVAVNCGALPAELMESELFGYVKGAHSTATGDQEGLFEASLGGTLFLDEIGDLPLDVQVKLLRALEQREIRRVGDTQTRTVDVRVVAATNKDLTQAVKDGEFREDLYFRLNTVVLNVPPLQERREDIPLLAAHFLAKCNAELGKSVQGIGEEALVLLRDGGLEGNVRGLQQRLYRAVLFAAGEWLAVDDFEPLAGAPVVEEDALAELDDQMASALEGGMTLPQFVAACEERAIRQALEASRSQQEAAQRLGIAESGLRKKMDKYGIARVRANRS